MTDNMTCVAQVDKQRAGYEGQVRELQSRIEESEANAAKNSKKLAQKLEQRIAEMETAVDAEHRRTDEVQKSARKQERRVNELLSQVEEEQRLKAQLQDNVDQLQQKLKTFKRQVEEAVRCARTSYLMNFIPITVGIYISLCVAHTASFTMLTRYSFR